MTTLLQARHLLKLYGNHEAVHDVSLNIKRGSLTAVIGPNGAGKSTTISMLIGISKPDGGTIEFPDSTNGAHVSDSEDGTHVSADTCICGHTKNGNMRKGEKAAAPTSKGTSTGNVFELKSASPFGASEGASGDDTANMDDLEPAANADTTHHQKRPTIGVVFQQSVLDPLLTARENLATRARLYHDIAPGRVAEVIALVHAEEFAYQRYGALSGGQRRSIDIARALINDPDLLVLDEPTTGLDITTRNALWSLLNRLRRQSQLSILLTTHYLEEAEHANQVYVIDHGCIKASGSAAELISRYAQYRLDLTLRPGTAAEARGRITAVLGTDTAPAQGTGSTQNAVHGEDAVPTPIASPTQAASPAQVACSTKDAAHVTLNLSNAAECLTILGAAQPYIQDFECRPGTMNDVFLALT